MSLFSQGLLITPVSIPPAVMDSLSGTARRGSDL